MVIDRFSEDRQVWISYINDDGAEVKGFFELIEQTLNFVKIKSGQNILIIPFHKINKVKMRCSDGN